MTREEYRAYLESPEWRVRRQWKLDEARNRCEVCNSSEPPIDVHHRTYERLGRERQSDLVVLCRQCHDRFHDKTHDAKDCPVVLRPLRASDALQRKIEEAERSGDEVAAARLAQEKLEQKRRAAGIRVQAAEADHA
jgi:hypothetical protein